jgi:hypothetical protein
MASLISVFCAKSNKFAANHMAMMSIASIIPFARLAEKTKLSSGNDPGTEQFRNRRRS